MTDFPPLIRINAILKTLPENTCGSASACIVFEKLQLTFDPAFFVSKGRDGNATSGYPISGSSVIGTALAMASTNLVEVEVYVDFDIEKEYASLEEYEKPIVDELKLLNNVTFKSSISIDEIVAKINNNCIPILAFNRNGKEEDGHFSPLRGLSDDEILLLPLDDAYGSCNCGKDEFISVWWKDKTYILVRKK